MGRRGINQTAYKVECIDYLPSGFLGTDLVYASIFSSAVWSWKLASFTLHNSDIRPLWNVVTIALALIHLCNRAIAYEQQNN